MNKETRRYLVRAIVLGYTCFAILYVDHHVPQLSLRDNNILGLAAGGLAGLLFTDLMHLLGD